MAFDARKVSAWVHDLTKRTNEPDMINIPKVHKLGILADEFTEFFETSPSLFKKVIFEEDLAWFNQFIKYNNKVESGQMSLEKAELELGKQLGDKYIPEELRNAPIPKEVISEEEQNLRRDAVITFFKNRVTFNDLTPKAAVEEIKALVAKGHVAQSVLDHWYDINNQ
jgi:hypothetical protein